MLALFSCTSVALIASTGKKNTCLSNVKQRESSIAFFLKPISPINQEHMFSHIFVEIRKHFAVMDTSWILHIIYVYVCMYNLILYLQIHEKNKYLII